MSCQGTEEKMFDAGVRYDNNEMMEVENQWESIKNTFQIIMSEAKEIGNDIRNSDGLEVLLQVDEIASSAIKTFAVLKKASNISTVLYMKKFEKYCEGILMIPLEKRRRYIELLGKDKFNKESVFVLTVLNRIEEHEKIDLFLKLLSAKMYNIITDDEYRRFMILTDRTLYYDLLYLKDNLTDNPIKLETDSDYGLVSSGLLTTAGIIVKGELTDGDSGIRYNYTHAAKKMAYIFFEVECDFTPSNNNITISEEELEEELEKALENVRY